MRRVQFVALRVVLGLSAAVSGGCRSATAPVFTTSDAAGTYVLSAVEGRGPASGSFVLTTDGHATRRVHYSVASVPGGEYVAAGTFALIERDSITFALREDGNVWRVSGTWRVSGFRLEYPDPADGIVVETYRRQDP
jgi:hypothetical protein